MPPDEIAVVLAAFEHWVRHSTAGKEYLVNLVGFDWNEGSSEYTYDVRDAYGRTLDRLKHDQIYFLQTAVAKGEFLSIHQVTPRPVEKHGCDKCGILSHCTRELKDSRGEPMKVCNHCLQFSEDQDDRARSGGLKECEGCTAVGCEHHPIKDSRRYA